MNSSAPAGGRTPDFELARDDALYRLQQRIGLIPSDGAGLVRRAVFWSLVGWLPIALWAVYVNRTWPGAVAEPLLAHFGVQARLLVAVPLLILAEGPASALTARLLKHFVESGIVPPGSREAFSIAVMKTLRLRDAVWPWVVVLAISVALGTYSQIVAHTHEVNWAEAGAAESIGFGGLWYLYVGRSIYLTLVLGWIWRIALLASLLWRIARLDLSLVPTHPDRAGGLGFLERLPGVFAPLAFAVSTVLASRWGHDAIYHGLTLNSVRVEMTVFIVACVLVFALPLLAFTGPLKSAKKRALMEYGALVGRHGRLVHERWIEGRKLDEQPILDAPELGPVADTAAIYGAVKSMRTVPLGKSSVLPVVLAAAIPMLAVLSLQVPVKAILKQLLHAIL
jgi:hypothetical protein